MFELLWMKSLHVLQGTKMANPKFKKVHSLIIKVKVSILILKTIELTRQYPKVT